MKRLMIAIAVLSSISGSIVAGSAKSAEMGVTRLFVNSSIVGAESLRVTVIDDLKIQIQQCDQSGAGCGKAAIYKRENKKTLRFMAEEVSKLSESKDNFVQVINDDHIIFSNVALNMFELGTGKQDFPNVSIVNYYYR